MSLFIYSSVCGQTSLLASNVLLFSSSLGAFLHLYSRKHLSKIEETEKFVYSSFYSLIFNFGSILFWCLSKAYLPDHDSLKLTFAIVSAVSFLYISRSYLKIVDKESD